MSAKRKSKKPEQKSSSPLLLRLMKWMFVLGLWAAIFIGGMLAWYASELPAIARSPKFERKTAITVTDRDGNTIARYGELKGESVQVKDLPPHLIHAVLATEDRRFYSHFGIDPIGLSRAVAANLLKGRVAQGGSTITQQLAKNLFLSQERTYKRKVQEALLALWLEHELSKDEILSAYLNRVYLGGGAYGVEAASRIYFNKSATKVNLWESATLAGLLKAPSRYSPTNSPERSAERAKVVLSVMVDAKYITQKEADNAKTTLRTSGKMPVDGDIVRYFTDWAVSDLDQTIGTPDTDITVQTALDPVIQKAAEEALTRTLDKYGEEKHVSQGVVIVMALDGSVVAMVGGRDHDLSEFNRAVQALRAPGSSFKPIVYLTALERGWRPTDLIEDAPLTIGKYRPENYDGEYKGEVSLAMALALSLNTATVRLAQAVGIGNVADTANNLGIRSHLQRDLSLALGSSGVKPLEMATAYTTIARGGASVFPHGLQKITDKDGTVLYQPSDVRSARQVVSPQAAQDLANMMGGVISFGTGRGAQVPFPASGKTGTSQDFRDAWFAGFSNRFVCVVWLGNDDNSSMKKVTGGSLPASIWREVMIAAQNRSRYYDTSTFTVPSSDPMDFMGADGFSGLIRDLTTHGVPSGSQPHYNQ
jgi:penicillin-binding protein 1A